MTTEKHSETWKTLLAFGVIYFVWGSTFLAIRIGVQEMPPFLMAAVRFAIAGAVLFAWVAARGEPMPNRREWRSIVTLALLIFVFDYGLVFWAEQFVPSGLTAVMLATIPAFMALSEIVFLRTQRMTLRLALALLVGLAGVAVLMSRSLNLGGAPVNRAGAIALIIAAINWSLGSTLTRKLPLPDSKMLSSGSQMLVGGLLLAVAAGALGEFHGFRFSHVSPGAWLALAYLIVFGSIIGFTAYLWLLHRESPTRVGTYAYVNPVVAVLLGYVAKGEPLGLRTILGTLFVLVSVVLITTIPRMPAPASAIATSEPAAMQDLSPT